MRGATRWMVGALVAALVAALAASVPSSADGDRPMAAEESGVRSAASALRPATRLSMASDLHLLPAGTRVVGYFAGWEVYGANGFEVADIPVRKLTHVNYAFVDVVGGKCELGDPWGEITRQLPTDDVTLPYRGSFNQLQVLKAKHPRLKTLLSVGGWTWSGGFSAATATPEGRRTLAASCVDLAVRYGFDGLDVDWEFPVKGGRVTGRPEDRENHAAFLAELRSHLDAATPASGDELLLTIAAPGGPTLLRNYDIPAIAATVDWINVMTYDFAGAFSRRTAHHAPLYDYPGISDPTFTVDSALRRWVEAGAPPEKLTAGLAFYGRGFAGVTDPTPGSRYSYVPSPSRGGRLSYRRLVDEMLDDADIVFDETARVPFAFLPGRGLWISYDDERSIAEKGRYVADNGFGGVMIWELSQDTADDQLLRAAIRGLGG